MSDLWRLLRLLLSVAAVVLFVSACLPKPAWIPYFGHISPYIGDMTGEGIADQIGLLEQALSGPTVDEISRPALHLKLAMLYSHPDNPDPDLTRAVEHLEAYAAAGGPVDSQYALSLLRRLEEKTAAVDTQVDRTLALQEKCDRLEQETRAQAAIIEEKNKIIEEQTGIIEEKTGIIEKLQSLDMKLEKKRQQTTGR